MWQCFLCNVIEVHQPIDMLALGTWSGDVPKSSGEIGRCDTVQPLFAYTLLYSTPYQSVVWRAINLPKPNPTRWLKPWQHLFDGTMKQAFLLPSLILIISYTLLVGAFSPFPSLSQSRVFITYLAEGPGEFSDMVARRIIVTGDVHGGYYRSCVKNEVRILPLWFASWVKWSHFVLSNFFHQASRFRKLVGTMTPPDDSQEAEIYVEVSAK